MLTAYDFFRMFRFPPFYFLLCAVVSGVLFLLIACDCTYHGYGVVVDRITGAPVSGVRVEVYLHEISGDSLATSVYSDDLGRFDFELETCSSPLFDLSKKGYIGFVTAHLEGDTIRIERNFDW